MLRRGRAKWYVERNGWTGEISTTWLPPIVQPPMHSRRNMRTHPSHHTLSSRPRSTPMSPENPFIDYGSIAEGDGFIGRRTSLQIVGSRVIFPPEPGNLAIIGLPRIGKSSLAHKAIIERKQELLARRFLPIWINLRNYTHSSSFFYALVRQCTDELRAS